MADALVGTMTTEDVVALLTRHRNAGLEADREADMIRGWPEESMRGRIPVHPGMHGASGGLPPMDITYDHVPRQPAKPKVNKRPGLSAEARARIGDSKRAYWVRWREEHAKV